MKKRRLAKIIELINKYKIETQEELQTYLKESGFDVTQATISRDIKELRLVKELSDESRYIYSTGVKDQRAETDIRMSGIFSESIISVDYAANMVCIKCCSGTAGAVCAAIDSSRWTGVLGTIAGDDTIFVLCRNEKAARVFTSNLEKVINVKNS